MGSKIRFGQMCETRGWRVIHKVFERRGFRSRKTNADAQFEQIDVEVGPWPPDCGALSYGLFLSEVF